ncbi:MAG: hypothetical protein M3541_00305 [Acidobacteriota bacterium]|nr:hypothetical protein [Acidobacteriota bacterium]MDQ3417225.1 hypothetical protein [Acidobacteriota bacterium]
MADNDFAPPTPDVQRQTRVLYDADQAAPLPQATGGELYSYDAGVEVIKHAAPNSSPRRGSTPPDSSGSGRSIRASAKRRGCRMA